MANKKISELPYINVTKISGNTLVPLVTYFSAATGDTVHTYVNDLKSFITSGITGNFLPLTGGTVSGTTVFLDPTGTITSIDSGNRILYDSTNSGSIDWENRNLLDLSGSNSVDYLNHQLNDSTAVTSADWEGRVLYDATTTLSVDWTNRQLLDESGIASIVFTSQRTLENLFGSSLDWGNKYLYKNDGSISFDWENGILTGQTNIESSTISATTYQNLPPATFSGGTVTGPTIFTNGLTANTISATTYQNLPTDVRVTGGTYSAGTVTFTNNTGGTFNVTGLTTGSTSTVSGNFLPLSGGTVTGSTTFTNGLTANTISATTYYNVSPNFQYEIHVSQVDGNDSTGDGSLLNPVASITKALTLITGQRRTIIIHPGSYTESPSITTQYTVLTTYEPLGGNTAIVGTVSTSVGCTIAGLAIQNLTITTGTGVGVPNIINCNISGTLTKSGNATFTDIHNCNIDTACNITGTGLVTINDGNPNFVTVNNAGANVIIKNAMSCVDPSVTAGTLNITDSIVVAYATNAVTSSAGSVITLGNSQFLTSALNNVAPVSLSGFYSIFNCVFDKPNSTLVTLSGTGGSTNSIDYFQYINADKFITQGGTSSQYVMGNGSLSNGFTGGTVSGSTSFTSGLTANTISATTYQNLPTDVRVTGSTYSNNTFTYTNNTGGTFNVLFNTVTGLTVNGNLTVTGNTSLRSFTGTSGTISGSGQNILTVIGSGNSTTSPLFSVQGSSGELFSINDSLVGSLFSVNDISGLPVVEVFSDNTTLWGSYQAPSLNTTTRVSLTAGTNTIYSIPTSAYTGAFYEYTLISTGTTGSRAGQIMSIWSGTSANFTETQTTSIGTTTGVTFTVAVSGNNAVLSSSATTTGWTLKTIVRSI